MKPLRELSSTDWSTDAAPAPSAKSTGHVAAAVRVVEHRGQRLGADHQHLPVGADPDERIGHGQGVDEARASLLKVQDWRRREAELRGHDGPGMRVRILGDQSW